jgi:cytochrome c oxidase subunit 2
MRRTRAALVSLLAVATLALATDPVAAQASATAELIEELNFKLLVAAVPVTLITQAALIYTVYKYRNNDEAVPTQENRRLEVSWTIATAIVLLFVGVASYGVLANENVTFQGGEEEVAPDENDVLVQADAYQWGWDMTYPNEGNVTAESGERGPVVYVPQGQDVYFEVTSQDVIHAFHVPELGLKQDAMPGTSNYVKTVPYETGTYQGYCAEFCGVAHSQMMFQIEVVPQDEYEEWIESRQNASSQSVAVEA